MSVQELPLWWEMDWAEPAFSRSQVDRAGERLAKHAGTPDELAHAVEVMNNWRASHSYPLNTFQMTLRNRARKIYPHANPVQRLKRAASIEKKLGYNPGMRLCRMQDIAGCRAIMPNVLLVDRLANRYERSDYHHFVKESDYIRNPKASGYRGIHLTYLYVADDDRFRVHDGQSVEIQLRSAHQHAWATAVEIVDTLTGQALKSGHGDPRWDRFFALMGTALANVENTERIPDTPRGKVKLRKELADLTVELNAEHILQAGRAPINGPPMQEKADLFLLKLDFEAMMVDYWSYRRSETEKATQHLADLETEARDRPTLNVVLVGAENLRALKKAYPNYFMDTTRFLDELNRALGKVA